MITPGPSDRAAFVRTCRPARAEPIAQVVCRPLSVTDNSVAPAGLAGMMADNR